MAMGNRADFDRAFDVVRHVIHEWDPYSLLNTGAPKDEWDGEIASVLTQISRIKSEKDAIHAISRVFSSAFQPEGFGPSECVEVGRKLFKALDDANLLGTKN